MNKLLLSTVADYKIFSLIISLVKLAAYARMNYRNNNYKGYILL